MDQSYRSREKHVDKAPYPEGRVGKAEEVSKEQTELDCRTSRGRGRGGTQDVEARCGVRMNAAGWAVGEADLWRLWATLEEELSWPTR